MANPPSTPLPRVIILAFAADITALILCLVITISGSDPWPALVVGLLAFSASALVWLRLKREGRPNPLATSAWALGLSSRPWAIGLIAAG